MTGAEDYPPSKRCTRCGEVKPVTGFYRDASHRDGRRTRCIACICVPRDPLPPGCKRCRTCRQIKPLGEFNRAALGRDGRAARCRACTAAAAAVRAQVFAHYGTACACCGTTEELGIDHVNGDGQAHRLAVFGDRTAGGRRFYTWLIAQGFPPGYQTLCGPCNLSKRDGQACRPYHGIDPGHKRCTGPCGPVKPIAAFNRDAATRDGLACWCRACASDRNREYYVRQRRTP